MSNFAIWIGGAWVVPPVEAMPIGIGSPRMPGAPIVRKNAPTARSGTGRPIAESDELFAIVGRANIGEAGLAWWYDTVGIQDGIDKPIAVRLWNPVTRAWTGYSGRMWTPTRGDGEAGYKIADFFVRISDLEPL